ncbi:PepSY-associated TM helix domain-containing protein [Dokdonia sp. Hel_I_53]|uniref:PepSY-associated TM helix domain-containing protein n=1 Tax=Dokdonia sp. Hel_I_53 TaxID=1566287 RepID=UPI00119B83DB|nr:PepSY-associated TM helix domain-containing protein [Dokdonia sp. Hel_I_53]TVZ53179.1 putative iron-regulated membrane protein [Dokdonia sp. Hel_I_53]
MRSKKIILQLHKILGLITGIVVFIVAITGCCWVFKEDIESLYDGHKKVKPLESPIISTSQARAIAEKVYSKNLVHGTVFKKKEDAIEVIFYDADPEFYRSIFLNPYTGEIIHIEDHLSGFFAFVLKGHTRLWLPKEIGEQVVGISVLLFILIIISGFILWLPKRRKNLKKRMFFDWKKTTRWKRKNFDLHSIVGFYVCSLALILAFTGTVMSYDWFQKSIYNILGGDKNPTFLIPKSETKSEDAVFSRVILPIDNLLAKLKNENPNAESFEIHYPYSDSDAIYVEVNNSEGLYYDSDFLFFDQYTLTPIVSETIYGKYREAKIADKILRMNYDIHIGAIGGVLGKCIAFLVSLLIASLPVTGLLLWYGRKFKRKKNN